MVAKSGKATDYVPERGDIVWISMSPQAGHEQAGRRPALVVSPEKYNGKVGLALMCPITSKVKGYPFEAGIPDQKTIGGVVLTDQIRSLDWRARSAEFIARADTAVTQEVIGKVTLLLAE